MRMPSLRLLLGLPAGSSGPAARRPGDARALVEVERAAGAPPPTGCAWLDDTTIADLELDQVVHALDRTMSPVGAQQLWRMVAAPAQQLDVLAARERSLAELAADPAARPRLRAELARLAIDDTAYVPLLLWSPRPRLASPWCFRALALALQLCAALATIAPVFALPALVLFTTNILIDDRVNMRLGRQARALEMLGLVLASAARIVRGGLGPGAERAALAAELPALTRLRRRIVLLTLRDPFELADILRAAFLVRITALASSLDQLERLREPLRRVHRVVGEMDALQAIVTLRLERPDAGRPELHEGPARLAVEDLRHPMIEGAVGNDLDLGAGSLVVTGSNMSGKSTFLRALALSAVLAQSLHTVFGRWRGSLFRVLAAMRARDATETGTSTYAAEVEAIGRLVGATAVATPPALCVLDEPFRGTNPTVRVPIVVAVLEHLATGHVVAAATHDLEVAARLSARFERVYFRERDPGGDGELSFDYTLRRGTAPTTNAVALLRRAGYPEAILRAIEAATATP